MNNFEKMLESLAQKVTQLDDDQVQKTKLVLDEMHQGLLLRQRKSTSAIEASLNSASNTFESDIHRLLQERSTVLNSQNQAWKDKLNQTSEELSSQIGVYKTLMVKSDLQQLREKITPQVQKDIEAKMGELGSLVEELKTRVLWVAGGVAAGMTLGMMLLWLSLPSGVEGQAPSKRMAAELNIAELRVILMHGYVMKELYPNLNEKRKAEIDGLIQTLELPAAR